MQTELGEVLFMHAEGGSSRLEYALMFAACSGISIIAACCGSRDMAIRQYFSQ